MGKSQKLNLINKFKKLFKYSYYVKIKNTPLNNEIEGAFFKYDKEFIAFNTNKKTYELLKNRNIIIESNYKTRKKHFKNFLLQKWISILSIIIIFLIFLFSENKIKKIIFSNDLYYSKEVIDVIYDNVIKHKYYYELKENINEISKNLRSRFPYYEWIGLRKKGNILYIDIVNLEPILIIPKTEKKGDLIAKKTAYIVNYHLESGLVVIDINQTVKKGDLLVSGNLNYENKSDKEQWVSPNGYVNGKTIERITINIPKKSKKEIYTGIKKSKIKLMINNKHKSFKSPYKLSFFQMETIFKFGIFRLVKETYFEKIINEYVITKPTAISHAKLQVETDFYKISRNPYEEITKMNVVNVIDKEQNYEITLIVTKIENIAAFKSAF